MEPFGKAMVVSVALLVAFFVVAAVVGSLRPPASSADDVSVTSCVPDDFPARVVTVSGEVTNTGSDIATFRFYVVVTQQRSGSAVRLGRDIEVVADVAPGQTALWSNLVSGGLAERDDGRITCAVSEVTRL
jgi:hypothetical protein